MATVLQIVATRSTDERKVISDFCADALREFVAALILPEDNPDMIAATQASALAQDMRSTLESEKNIGLAVQAREAAERDLAAYKVIVSDLRSELNHADELHRQLRERERAQTDEKTKATE